jgi:hypothetical protein
LIDRGVLALYGCGDWIGVGVMQGLVLPRQADSTCVLVGRCESAWLGAWLVRDPYVITDCSS